METSSPAPLDVLSAVKEATRPEHLRAERQLALMGRSLDEREYRSLLEAFLNFYSAAEAQLERALSTEVRTELEFSSRLKTPWLEADLKALGSRGDAASPDFSHLLPPSASEASALGVMYVMEGATLGGQVISRHLATTLPAGCQKALHFYRGYGEQTGARWKQFQSWVQSRVTTPEAQKHYCESAVRTFRAFNDALASWPAARS